MHIFFELIPLVLFFILSKTVDIYWATGALIVCALIQVLYFVVKKEKVPTRYVVAFILLAVFGGLTIAIQDPAFIQWKVSISFGLIAITLLLGNVIFNKNLVEKALNTAIKLPSHIWQRLNYAVAGYFAICSLFNWYVALNFSIDTWVSFKVFGLLAMLIAFASIVFVLIAPSLEKWGDQEKSA